MTDQHPAAGGGSALPMWEGRKAAQLVPADVERAVRERYSLAAQAREPALCCAVDYAPDLLQHIPAEILERDYGCGDPSRFVQPGETILDLGSGGGKICYIAAKVVGPRGRVIGVDCNDEMLDLARRHQGTVAERLGYSNVTFHKGRIQDLQLDLDRVDQYLAAHPVHSSGDWQRLEEEARLLREAAPLIPAGTIDVIVSNCVLNLVRKEDRQALFAEMARVLRPAGRVVISDIVSDVAVPARLQNDPQLWSGCLSGAFQEQAFLAAFESAGFYGIEILARQPQPWMVVEGIEFRSVTLRAYARGPDSAMEESASSHALIYRGPWKTVTGEDGRAFERGSPVFLSESARAGYQSAPYAGQFLTAQPGAEQQEVEKCCGGSGGLTPCC